MNVQEKHITGQNQTAYYKTDSDKTAQAAVQAI